MQEMLYRRRGSLELHISNPTDLSLVLPQAPFPRWHRCFLSCSISPELLPLTCPSHVPVFGPFCFLCGRASAFFIPDVTLLALTLVPLPGHASILGRVSLEPLRFLRPYLSAQPPTEMIGNWERNTID